MCGKSKQELLEGIEILKERFAKNDNAGLHVMLGRITEAVNQKGINNKKS